jgi:hypothetical protein
VKASFEERYRASRGPRPPLREGIRQALLLLVLGLIVPGAVLLLCLFLLGMTGLVNTQAKHQWTLLGFGVSHLVWTTVTVYLLERRWKRTALPAKDVLDS